MRSNPPTQLRSSAVRTAAASPLRIAFTISLCSDTETCSSLMIELLDIRLVLSRTLVYGLTLAVVVAAYAGIVAALSLLVPATARTSVSVLAALAVALALNPVRLLIQRSIGQAFFGYFLNVTYSRNNNHRDVAGCCIGF